MRRRYEEHWRELPPDPEPWRWAWRRELLLAELRPGDRWLDLGCGAGRFTALAANAIGVEVAPAALERARANVPGGDFRLVEEDGTLPLGHGEVDVVWCSEVLEHVPDTVAFLTEARRVLKRGGRLLVTVPGHGLVRRTAIALLRYDAHYDPLGQHVRFYTRRSLTTALAATGFEDVAISGLTRGALLARAIRP